MEERQQPTLELVIWHDTGEAVETRHRVPPKGLVCRRELPLAAYDRHGEAATRG